MLNPSRRQCERLPSPGTVRVILPARRGPGGNGVAVRAESVIAKGLPSMCGVFGYVGTPADLGATLVAALRSLQYRGYDSWGIGVAIGDKVRVEKQVGHVNGASFELPLAAAGFGHTRRATHGGVTT